ncbi:glycosyltransferase family 4 protein [uncultured Christiangramia sp.]|uniref:glycosyltransferase family 4 protein n=1 Tax=uncultured Christiangramia sp. TaxID=503836 RepID=UPI002604F094|nr:glycosyltransferase family 4 protein [uncultured Christiangramia sp.]
MKFAIITYIEHSAFKGNLFSYEPYISEMNIWLKHVNEVKVLAPKIERKPLPGEIAYSQDLNFVEVSPLNFTKLRDALRSVVRLPGIVFEIFRIFREADHIHLRCPGNISLLGCIVQIFFPKKQKTVKYAGNWDPDSDQPLSYRLQKWILKNRFLSRNIKVLVYGKWKNQSANIVPFFTASFSKEDIIPVSKEFDGTLKFIFVGSLTEGKRPLLAIKIVERLIFNGVNASLKIYGNGVLLDELKNYIKNSKFSEAFSIEGFINKNELKQSYKESHFLILPSRSEGWPKAVAEAMFFGCIPIATNVSCVSWMMGEGERGVVIPADPDKAINIILDKLKNRDTLKAMSAGAQKWSQQYTLERFETEIRKFL